LEQLDALCEKRGSENSHGFDLRRERVKTRTLKTEGCGTPPKQIRTNYTNSTAPIGGPPALVSVPPATPQTNQNQLHEFDRAHRWATRRYYGKGHLHFITFRCYRRLPLLKTVRARNIFVKELGKVRDDIGFLLLGYVVMPEHVHLLMSEPKQGTPSTVLQRLMLRVARKLRRRGRAATAGQMRLPFAEAGESLRAFWQARFYDFNVYSKGKKMEKLNYMHANPVIRGPVKHPRDCVWRSWGFYYGEGGLLAVDMEE
jgi:REP-associated tyrosine transposase